MSRCPLLRAAAVGLAALGVFSLAFSLLAERGLWPRLPAGALHGTDLVAGFAVAVGLIVLLLRRPNRARGADHAPVPSDVAVAATAGEAATGGALPPPVRSPE